MKKNTWNVKRLVDESFVPSAQRTSVLYRRLSDFTSQQILLDHLPDLFRSTLHSETKMAILSAQSC